MKTLKAEKQARHGDLLLTKIEELPQNSPHVANTKMILAQGTATGHAHVMSGKDCKFYKNEKDGTIYVKIDKTAKLTHEEHATIEFGKGIWKVQHQVEYGPDETARQVAD